MHSWLLYFSLLCCCFLCKYILLNNFFLRPRQYLRNFLCFYWHQAYGKALENSHGRACRPTNGKGNTKQCIQLSAMIIQLTNSCAVSMGSCGWRNFERSPSYWVWGMRLDKDCKYANRNCRERWRWNPDMGGGLWRSFGQRVEMRGRRRFHRQMIHRVREEGSYVYMCGQHVCIPFYPYYICFIGQEFVCVLVCVFFCVIVGHVMWGSRGKLTDVSLLLPLWELWVSNSGPQVYGQDPSHTELSHFSWH